MAHVVLLTSSDDAQPSSISLPKPHMSGGQPLCDALRNRKTTREFSSRLLDFGLLADLLWAANGYNRPESRHRTAPPAHNRQEIDVYVALGSGLYLYDAEDNQLLLVKAEDLRTVTGEQDFVAVAPVDLIYVADHARTRDAVDRAEAEFYATIDTGFIAQNVYLFCASKGLATVVRGRVPRPRLASLMGLKPEQQIIVAQSIGYPT